MMALFTSFIAFLQVITFAFAFPTRNLPHSRTTLDKWVASESSVALSNLLANIGATGAKSYGAAAGIVLASPSKANPDCTDLF